MLISLMNTELLFIIFQKKLLHEFLRLMLSVRRSQNKYKRIVFKTTEEARILECQKAERQCGMRSSLKKNMAAAKTQREARSAPD